MQAASSRGYSAGFWLMCLSSFFFFLSFNLLIPELPDHLTRLGGAEYKGFIISLFTLTAGLSRPFSGKLSDTVGRVPVMVVGSLVCFICGFFYVGAATVTSFLVLRLLHGFSTGFKPTGTAAYVADIVPVNRRGAAMGLLGVSGTLGMAVGPALTEHITGWFGLNGLFYTSSILALLSLLVQGTLTETLPAALRRRFSWQLLRLDWRREVLEPRVLAPALVTMLCMFPYGAIITLAPDHSQALGLANKGIFYTYYTLATLFVRLVASRASDRYGRVPVLRVSALLMVGALMLLALADAPWLFLSGAALYGFSTGLNSPTLYAWTVDLSDPDRRGRGVATMYIALEVGIGLGALLAGSLYANHTSHLPWVYETCAGCVGLAWLYLLRQPARQVAVS